MRKFLDTCIDIEDTIAAIYRQFAETVSCDEALKKIWEEMANEEDQHASLIRFASRLPRKDTFLGQKMTQDRVDQLLYRLKVVLERAKVAPLTVESALRVSMKLEGEFTDVHAASAAEFIDIKMKEMFQKLASGDKEHKQALEDYYLKFFGHEG